ncbi:acyl-CoA dehydrogenase family protein [Aliihoeflea sp. 2WW]|uniref:acyl-CoA dehydrogenase family protein n=1 Tax=Aliihoeflea sp. 2WW TaxID=1381123 RepID=UPI0004654CBB|nr:acyl-CoA dehydrogenase family protein [Aliihoeflea sp. 2WW]
MRKTSPWVNDELEAFRRTVRHFFETVVTPHREQWEAQQHVDRSVWKKAGELGLICASVPEEYGGMGGTFAHEAIIVEEQARAGDTAFGLIMGSPMALPPLLNYGSVSQKRKYMPEIAAGNAIVAFALTEPGAGSDAKAIQTTARRDGHSYVLNGQKTFISNGYNADLATVVARTGPAETGAGGISAFFVDLRELEGYSVGRILKKIGQKGQDTAELFFDDCRIPADALLGGVEGRGFGQIITSLQAERTILGLYGVAYAEQALELTLEYVKSRQAFGKSLFDFQNTRFKLAECATKVRISRLFIDDCIARVLEGTIDPATASMAKYWGTDLQVEVIDTCLQFFGGYGYMTDYPIARMFADARVQRIYGGANEIQKEVIARSL